MTACTLSRSSSAYLRNLLQTDYIYFHVLGQYCQVYFSLQALKFRNIGRNFFSLDSLQGFKNPTIRFLLSTEIEQKVSESIYSLLKGIISRQFCFRMLPTKSMIQLNFSRNAKLFCSDTYIHTRIRLRENFKPPMPPKQFTRLPNQISINISTTITSSIRLKFHKFFLPAIL